MSKLPVISGHECIKALEKAGFYFKRQEGSHIVMRRDDPFGQVVVPDHRIESIWLVNELIPKNIKSNSSYT
jgi:predicted RNA binding protein YcfA (HicA-like mRNA interferase family)